MLYDNDGIYTVGLTGMSGAGKTTACEIFAAKGFRIIDCDIIAREVVEPGKPALRDIAAYFGSDILNPDGSLNRKKLGGIVFGSKEKLGMLNSLIYPYITFDIIKKIRAFSESGDRTFLLDAPTLFESGADIFCDSVISVVSDKKSCIERIMKRDGITAAQAENRLSSQHDASFYRERSRFCADNSGTREEFELALGEIAVKLKGTSKNPI